MWKTKLVTVSTLEAKTECATALLQQAKVNAIFLTVKPLISWASITLIAQIEAKENNTEFKIVSRKWVSYLILFHIWFLRLFFSESYSDTVLLKITTVLIHSTVVISQAFRMYLPDEHHRSTLTSLKWQLKKETKPEVKKTNKQTKKLCLKSWVAHFYLLLAFLCCQKTMSCSDIWMSCVWLLVLTSNEKQLSSIQHRSKHSPNSTEKLSKHLEAVSEEIKCYLKWHNISRLLLPWKCDWP